MSYRHRSLLATWEAGEGARPPRSQLIPSCGKWQRSTFVHGVQKKTATALYPSHRSPASTQHNPTQQTTPDLTAACSSKLCVGVSANVGVGGGVHDRAKDGVKEPLVRVVPRREPLAALGQPQEHLRRASTPLDDQPHTLTSGCHTVMVIVKGKGHLRPAPP
jgi:hypothetical protein